MTLPFLLLTLALTAGPETPVPADTTTKPAKPEKAGKRFSLDVGGLLQLRGGYDTLSEEGRYSIPRARFLLKGGLDKLLEMNLGVDLGDFEARFVNAFVNVRAFKKDLQVRLGRMKRPFLRERLTSASDLVLVDRSILSGTFGDKRDYGLMLHNGLEGKEGLEWAVGLFGDYDAEDFLEDKDKPEFNSILALRLGYAMDGLDGYDDVDRHGGPIRVGGSAAALVAFDRAAPEQRETGYRVEADVLLRLYGVTLNVGALASSLDVAVAKPDRIGVFGAADVFFLGMLDVGARYSLDRTDEEQRSEALVSVGTWLFEDHLRIVLDGAWLGHRLASGSPVDADEGRVRVQVQVK